MEALYPSMPPSWEMLDADGKARPTGTAPVFVDGGLNDAFQLGVRRTVRILARPGCRARPPVEARRDARDEQDDAKNPHVYRTASISLGRHSLVKNGSSGL
jgi:hypothetical protein